MRAPSQILSVAQMRAAEEALIAGGETVESLMERAGRGAADYVWRVCAGRPVTVLCGPGNNGGDGYVIARELRRAGVPVRIVAPLEPRSNAARAARASLGAVEISERGEEISGEVLVDCLFGSGLARPLDDGLAALLRGLCASHQRRIAVDVPSGVDSDSGAIRGEALPDYHLTLALGAWKFAHWLMPAMARMGERRLVDIGVGAVPGAARLIARPILHAPPADAHKYSRGLVAVIGGVMPGAGVLATRAAMRAGAGYVKLLGARPSLALPDELVVDDRPLASVLSDKRINALLVGPGLGRDDAAKSILAGALSADLPTICDADGLMLLEPAALETRSAPLTVTPHEGELAQLCAAFAVADGPRMERVIALADAMRAIVVAKGPDNLVAVPGEPLHIAPAASPWLSTAGTGDVLAGLVASRLATGASPGEAAMQAIWLHSEAARRAGTAFTAGDIIDRISDVYRSFIP